MAAKSKDTFANMAIITVTESAANTLTFKKLESGISLTEKVAWLIHKIEYVVGDPSAAQFNASGDTCIFGLSLSASFTTPSIAETTIIDWRSLVRLDWGAAANMTWFHSPIVQDYTNLPMGGVIIPPNPLYLFTRGTGLVSAMTIVARLWYTLYELSTEDFWQLVEARRVPSS